MDTSRLGHPTPAAPVPSLPERLEAVNRWERGAITVWTALLLFFCVRALLWPRAHSVYPIFSTAARNWMAGTDLYKATGEFDIYRYSPLVTVLLVPLASLPVWLGGVLWRILDVGVYLAALTWWSRAVLPRILTRTHRAMLFLLVVVPSIGSVINGQSNLLVMGLLLAALAAVTEERWNLASTLVALACLFKLYPIAVGLLLALIYPRRFLVRLVAALIVGFALPFVLQNPAYVARQYTDWAQQLQEDDRQGRPRELWYRDFRLLDWMWGRPLTSRSYLIVQLTAAAGIAATCGYAARRRWPERRLLRLLLSLSCCWMTVMGPATEPSTYTLLAPSLAWALLEAWLERRGLFRRGLLVASYSLLVAYHVAGWFPVKIAFRNAGPEALAGLLFFGGLMATGLRDLARQGRSLDTSPRDTEGTANRPFPGRAA
jgi:hypothetical protein